MNSLNNRNEASILGRRKYIVVMKKINIAHDFDLVDLFH